MILVFPETVTHMMLLKSFKYADLVPKKHVIIKDENNCDAYLYKKKY